MGLDAFVFCDCYEQKRLKTPPPNPKLVYVMPNGDLDCRSKDADVIEKFDTWRESACKHHGGFLACEAIGDLWDIEDLRDALGAHASRFTVLLKQVLYSGSHTGDHVTLRSVEKLQIELELLRTVRTGDTSVDKNLRALSRQLNRLVRVALKVRKPIAF